ncbi:hypothetical protein AK812_SmicGene37782 [Symbiodinium microadriaticum]|uniref:3'-5' exonuclease domain-containing protein n=1 Tax=Symbiodinium microadriaticum TaxID=2951 RepID=A0A1Q9CFD0_SYMMI|nr:hypothetical protein AK812_SmicGene37782 [Symbiodinium microadriaticum]
MAMKDLDPVHARQYSGLTADSFEVTLIEDDSSGELLSLNNYIADEDLMAFDAEWQPESPRTDGVHVLQMAFPSKQRVFVVQLWALKEPHLTCLKTSFQRRARKIVGWGATEDIHRLSNIFRLDWKRKIFDIQPVAGILMKEADAGAGIRGIKLSKDSSVTCSDWSAPLASLPEALALFERRWGPQGSLSPSPPTSEVAAFSEAVPSAEAAAVMDEDPNSVPPTSDEASAQASAAAVRKLSFAERDFVAATPAVTLLAQGSLLTACLRLWLLALFLRGEAVEFRGFAMRWRLLSLLLALESVHSQDSACEVDDDVRSAEAAVKSTVPLPAWLCSAVLLVVFLILLQEIFLMLPLAAIGLSRTPGVLVAL